MDSLDHCECAVIALVLTHYLAAAIRYRPQQLSSTSQPVSEPVKKSLVKEALL